jgi:hypothetical protein
MGEPVSERDDAARGEDDDPDPGRDALRLVVGQVVQHRQVVDDAEALGDVPAPGVDPVGPEGVGDPPEKASFGSGGPAAVQMVKNTDMCFLSLMSNLSMRS